MFEAPVHWTKGKGASCALFIGARRGGEKGRAQSAPELGSLHLVAPVAQGCAGERLLISRVQWLKGKVL